MRDLIEFTANGLKPENPSVAFAYDGMQPPNLTVPSYMQGRQKMISEHESKARNAARKVRQQVPNAFQQYTEAAEEVYKAEKELKALKNDLDNAPSAVDAYAMEMEGGGEEAAVLIASKEELEEVVERQEAAVRVKRGYFQRLCADKKALKELNDALKAEASKRAEKAADSTRQVLDAIQTLEGAIEAFDNYSAENLTVKATSTMPISPGTTFTRLKTALKKETGSVLSLLKGYERHSL